MLGNELVMRHEPYSSFFFVFIFPESIVSFIMCCVEHPFFFFSRATNTACGKKKNKSNAQIISVSRSYCRLLNSCLVRVSFFSSISLVLIYWCLQQQQRKRKREYMSRWRSLLVLFRYADTEWRRFAGSLISREGGFDCRVAFFFFRSLWLEHSCWHWTTAWWE